MHDIFDAVVEHGRTKPDATALVRVLGRDRTVRMTFSELAAAARRFCRLWRSYGSPGEVVPVFSAKHCDSVAAIVGAVGAGVPFAPLNAKLKEPQVASILMQTGAHAGVIDGLCARILAADTGSELKAPRIRWWPIRDATAPKPFQRALTALESAGGLLPSGGSGASDEVDDPIRPAPDGDADGCCLFTSGTTGRAKGVRISRADLVARAEAEIEWFGLDGDDVLLNVLPFSFDVGMNQLLTALTCGATLVMLESWLPSDIVAAVETYGVSGMSGVPSIWKDFLAADVPLAPDGPLATLRFVTVSGGDLSPSNLERLPELLPGVGIFKTYGQTETFRTTCLRPHEFEHARQSVGRAFGGAQVMIVDEEGQVCSPGLSGQVVHAGPGTMSGYLDGQGDSEKLRQSPFPGAAAGAMAIYTGDRGHLDENSYLYLEGRSDDMLKISGNRVYPREILDRVMAFPGVADAHVMGYVEDETMQLAVFVVPTAAGDFDMAVFRRQLAQGLPSYMVPKYYESAECLPRTPSGKTDVQALRVVLDQRRLTGR